MSDTQHIAKIALDEKTVVRRNADIEHERKVAIFDILDQNSFIVNGFENDGPYSLHLSIEDNRLIIDVRSEDDANELVRIPLPVISFRRIIKDYFHVCESYFDAIKSASPSKIEAIDMGRRGLHNEGSELLKERLKDRAETDFDTARRLFTLMCILHIRG
ncbi:UPF0262 family protein [Sneathiella sp. HT1-7]|jgi:uncharacterized protein (UPF0262 family)|uniref:UPF0262 family protein n=1 Tax=Sneathiella sp. HT1-7 TaxID=2887192 RepID=UPI001D14656E|nr:UPF0262 family protein [Sneathiella sp. HT1-7]MCC3304354.1 UPF0262 family protein [Sneathiella sp. HT1-7]